MTSRTLNNFVIPTPDGGLVLHISPGPCSNQEHWLDPLHLNFRESLRCHMGVHSLIGIVSVIIQLASRTQDGFAWYGRSGLGTWAGTMFFLTCLVGSYATHSEISSRSMRAWLVVYVIFCFFSAWIAGSMTLINAIYANMPEMAEWQHGVLAVMGAIEFFFCIVEITLVVFRLCTTNVIPNGFDFHVAVSYLSGGEAVPVRQIGRAEQPPPSYEQLFIYGRETLQLPGSERIVQDERISPSPSNASSTSTLGSTPLGPDRPNDIPLGVAGRDSTQELLP